MKVFILLLLCLSAALSSPLTRIIGGQEALAGQFPWQAAIYATTTQQQHFCGGVLITHQWILTAAQCVNNPRIFAVHLGTLESDPSVSDQNRQIIATGVTVIHEDYDEFTLLNDIAMLRAHMPLTLTDYIQPISLATAADVIDISKTLQASGWGEVDVSVPAPVPKLHYVDLVEITNQECQIFYTDDITETRLCASGNSNEGICFGDTGGPLVGVTTDNRNVIVGIGSFFSGRGCDDTTPSGFTRGSSYAEWVDTSIENYENSLNK